MIVFGNIFYIIIFISIVGSVFSILALLAKKVLHIVIPLWFDVCGICFFLIPFIIPTLWLISPEEPSWVYGYKVACAVWLFGAIGFGVYYITRSILACYALKEYRVCDDERINRIYYDCMSISDLKKAPVLYFGTLNEPACVVTFFRPAVILNEVIVKQLMDKELGIVLCHELTHIKRKHHIYQNTFNLINILHWFNLFAWIYKNDFAEHCEIDCDQKALSIMNDKVTEIEYATAMLHLMELSSNHRKHKAGGLKALGYLHAKQRMNVIFNESTRVWRMICMIILVFFITLTVLFSVYVSRSYFYPYSVDDIASEYLAYYDAY